MADKDVNQQASDLFNLGANFKAQRSSSNTRNEIVEALDDVGDVHEQVERSERVDYSCTYHYVGTDLDTDLTIKLGKVENSIIVDSISIKFKEKAPVEVDISGHNHTTNAHAASAVAGDFDGFDLDLTTIIGDGIEGFDVPSDLPFVNADTDSDQIGLTLAYSCEHQDHDGSDGDHWVGKSFNGLLTVTCEFIGTPSLTIGDAWVTESSEAGDGNREPDMTTVTARMVLDRTVVPEA